MKLPSLSKTLTVFALAGGAYYAYQRYCQAQAKTAKPAKEDLSRWEDEGGSPAAQPSGSMVNDEPLPSAA